MRGGGGGEIGGGLGGGEVEEEEEVLWKGGDKRGHRRRKESRWQFAVSALPTNTGASKSSSYISNIHLLSLQS